MFAVNIFTAIGDKLLSQKRDYILLVIVRCIYIMHNCEESKLLETPKAEECETVKET